MNKYWSCCTPVLLVVLILGCAATVPKEHKVVSGPVAIWNFEDLSPFESGMPDLSDLLTAKAAEAVQNLGTLELVERDKLDRVLEELNLGSSELADESSRLKLGRLSGAKIMLFSAYQVIGGKMRLDMRLIEVESGKVINAESRVMGGADIGAWLNAAGEMAAGMLK